MVELFAVFTPKSKVLWYLLVTPSMTEQLMFFFSCFFCVFLFWFGFFVCLGIFQKKWNGPVLK